MLLRQTTWTVLFVIALSCSGQASKQRSCRSPQPQPFLTPCYCDSLCEFYDACCDRYFNKPPPVRCLNLAHVRTCPGVLTNVVFGCPAGAKPRLKRLCPTAGEKTFEMGLARRSRVASEASRVFWNVYCALCPEVGLAPTPQVDPSSRKFASTIGRG